MSEKYCINMKSEPAGEYTFGELSNEDIINLKNAFNDDEKVELLDFWVMPEDFSDLGAVWGCSINDFHIDEDEDSDLVYYTDITANKFNIDYSKNAIYIFCSKPTTLLTEVNLDVLKGDFNPEKLKIEYINVNMPELSDSYGEISNQIIASISYDNVDYTEEMWENSCDRFFTKEMTIFQIYNNKFYEIVKRDSSGNIEWVQDIK